MDEIDIQAIPESIAEEAVIREVRRSSLRQRMLPPAVRMGLALLLCTATVVCKMENPDAGSQLRRWIVGDGTERVQQAFFSLEQALVQGQGTQDAWEVFCRELADETA